ncbi:hypothetical protein [Kitasatospora sp. NPDC087271]|uniref:hypothetical protein n=1 Tax=Kitasatospora sp. NPDC087271 TaxID=3364067 RepID=UPI00380C4DD6
MPKKPQSQSFRDLVASMPPSDDWYGAGVPSPAGLDEFTDDEGQQWHKVRSRLQPRLAKRLMTTADVVIVGEGAGSRFRHVSKAERSEVWGEVGTRLHASVGPSYEACEFVSASGLSMLYLEESC